DGHDHRGVRIGREAIVLALPACRWGGLAVPGHIEGHHPVAFEYLRVVEHGAPLAPVGSGSVQTKERNALSGLLVINAMRPAVELQMCIAAGDRLDHRR